MVGLEDGPQQGLKLSWCWRRKGEGESCITGIAPIPALGLHMTPLEFIKAAKYRLGCHIYEEAGPCPACLRHSDRFGDHALSCGHWGERISRHNAIRDHIHGLAVKAVLNPSKEGRFILPGADRRPPDVMVPS